MARKKVRDVETPISMPSVPELTLVPPPTYQERKFSISQLLLGVAIVLVILLSVVGSGMIGYAMGSSEKTTVTSLVTSVSVSTTTQIQVSERWNTVTVVSVSSAPYPYYQQNPQYPYQQPYPYNPYPYQQGYTVTVTLYSANPNLSPMLQAYQLGFTPASVPMSRIGFSGNRYVYRGVLTTLTPGASYILRISGGNCPLWLQPITLNGPLTYTIYGTP